MTVYKGTKTFENLYYRYAFTFYYDRSYLAASYHFKNFCDLFPKSTKTEECAYLNSLCLYNLSPDYTLDQSNTVKSIGELQTFVNTHPDSKRIADANKYIDDSRDKLEIKDNYGAELYFKIGSIRLLALRLSKLSVSIQTLKMRTIINSWWSNLISNMRLIVYLKNKKIDIKL